MSLNPLVTAITPPQGSSGGVAETEVPLLQQIVNLLAGGAGGGGQGSVVVNGSGFAYDYQSFAYFTGTNNISSITYRTGGAAGSIVAVTRFNYDTPAVDNANITVIATTST